MPTTLLHKLTALSKFPWVQLEFDESGLYVYAIQCGAVYKAESGGVNTLFYNAFSPDEPGTIFYFRAVVKGDAAAQGVDFKEVTWAINSDRIKEGTVIKCVAFGGGASKGESFMGFKPLVGAAAGGGAGSG